MPTAGKFEWAEEQGINIVLDTPTVISTLQMRMTFCGYDAVSATSCICPPIQYPGNVMVKVAIKYEEI